MTNLTTNRPKDHCPRCGRHTRTKGTHVVRHGWRAIGVKHGSWGNGWHTGGCTSAPGISTRLGTEEALACAAAHRDRAAVLAKMPPISDVQAQAKWCYREQAQILDRLRRTTSSLGHAELNERAKATAEAQLEAATGGLTGGYQTWRIQEFKRSIEWTKGQMHRARQEEIEGLKATADLLVYLVGVHGYAA